MDNRVHIYLIDGSMFAISGDAHVDPVEQALVIGDGSDSYVKFNWNVVLYFTVNAMEV
jgi:hypothetical protein